MDQAENKLGISIPTRLIRRITGSLFGAYAILLCAAVFYQFSFWYLHINNPFGAARIFNFDSDLSIPNWFSSLLLAWCSLLIGLNAQGATSFRFHWWLLAALFLGLSLDEGVALHEHFNVYQSIDKTPWNYFPWTIGGTTLCIVLAFTYLRFLLHLPVWLRTYFVASGVIYVGGALGFELLSAMWLQHSPDGKLVYTAMTIVEESLEMIGAIVFQHALMKSLSRKLVSVPTFPI